MQRVFANPTEIEKIAKKTYGIPDFLMMENAAASMSDFILSLWTKKNTDHKQETYFSQAEKYPEAKTYPQAKVLIVCGKGNNGGDGYALARKLQGKADVSLYCFEKPVAKSSKKNVADKNVSIVSEAVAQFEMCKRLGIRFIQKEELTSQLADYDFIVDCLYGTGFHGELNPQAAELIRLLNGQATSSVQPTKNPASQQSSQPTKTQASLQTSHCIKIACDIPSGIDIHGNLANSQLTQATQAIQSAQASQLQQALCFFADYTISMGTQKLCFYSDSAKQACGKIIVAELGLDRNKFEEADKASPKNSSDTSSGNTSPATFSEAFSSPLYLIEKDDIKLPLRKNAAAHKGTYGHTAVFAGEKSGAAIIAATAAMNFGSGLTTLVKTNNSNLEQFKISPELMLSNSIPAKTTCLVIGPGMNGLTELKQKERAGFLEWFDKNEKAAVVFDAGIVSSEDFIPLLKELSKKIKTNKQDSSENKLPRIVLTPHLLEFSRFCRNIKTACTSGYFDNKAFNFVDEDFSIDTLTKSPETKIKLGKMITALFPNTTLLVKSANTFIFTAHETSASETSVPETYIIADGAPSLAKGGSGDILAGMIGALLAQGYTAKEAAVTACEVHALAAASYGKEAFDLTPEKLIAKIATGF